MQANFTVQNLSCYTDNDFIVVKNYHNLNQVTNYPINSNYNNLAEFAGKDAIAVFKIKWK